jgi:predicted nucleic acid-binding protein
LAQSIHADLLLMDERKGVKVARDRGLNVTGILGLLEIAAQRELVDLAETFGRLKKTSFRSPAGLMEALLRRRLGQK